MKKLFTAIGLFLSVLVLMPEKSSATHLAGAEIVFIYIKVHQILTFRVKIYRDCSGIALGNPEQLYVELCTPLGFSFAVNSYTIDFANSHSKSSMCKPPCCKLRLQRLVDKVLRNIFMRPFIPLLMPATDWGI